MSHVPDDKSGKMRELLKTLVIYSGGELNAVVLEMVEACDPAI